MSLWIFFAPNLQSFQCCSCGCCELHFNTKPSKKYHQSAAVSSRCLSQFFSRRLLKQCEPRSP